MHSKPDRRTEMTSRNNRHRRIKSVITLMLIAAFGLLFCGCRSRITDASETATTIVDDDGMMKDAYEMRRYELDLYETKESIFSGLASSSDDEEYGDYDDEDFDDMMDEYEDTEEPEDEENEPEDDSDDDSSTTTRTPTTTTQRTPVRTPVRTPTTTTKPGTTTPATSKYLTVTLDPNGGEVSTATKRVQTDKTYGAFPVPEFEGYSFEGWYTKKTDGEKVTSKTKVTAKKDHTLYAHWKAIPEETFTITYDPNGGEIKTGDSTKLLHKNDKYGSFPGVMQDGYKLTGWFTAAEGGNAVSEGDVFDGSGNITLYAQWEYDAYGYWSTQLSAWDPTDDDKVECYVEDGDGAVSNKEVKGWNIKTVSADDDAGIAAAQPVYFIKVIKDMSKAEDARDKILERIGALDPEIADEEWRSNLKIIIVPREALIGTDNEKLYYNISINAKIYEGVFTDDEIDQAGNELDVHTLIE